MPSKQFINSRIEIESILRETNIGYLGLSADGAPYVVPLNYAYADGAILFHCALTGKKLDILRANPQVCFNVGQQAGPVVRHAEGSACHPDFDSVICSGTARIIDDLDERTQALNTFNNALQPGSEAIDRETAAKCCAVVIRITEMTGRSERDSQSVYWRYLFEQNTEAAR